MARSAETAVTASDVARMRQLVHRRRRLSERHPSLYPLAVWVSRCRRRLRWLRGNEVWAMRRTPPADMPYGSRPTVHCCCGSSATPRCTCSTTR